MVWTHISNETASIEMETEEEHTASVVEILSTLSEPASENELSLGANLTVGGKQRCLWKS